MTQDNQKLIMEAMARAQGSAPQININHLAQQMNQIVAYLRQMEQGLTVLSRELNGIRLHNQILHDIVVGSGLATEEQMEEMFNKYVEEAKAQHEAMQKQAQEQEAKMQEEAEELENFEEEETASEVVLPSEKHSPTKFK
jgi:DNA-binding transcriptional regulator YbjK